MAKGKPISKPYEKHGLTPGRGARPARVYRIWQDMRGRCYDLNDQRYRDYGGRGITVCDRWRYSVIAFVADMGHPPTPKHSLDRINNDGNYEPSNCRWATFAQQAQNTRHTKANLLLVRAIRILREHEGFTYDALAEMFNLTKTNVSQIATGRTWKDV